MHFKTIALILGLAHAANAAGISYKLPSTLGNIVPVYMPGASIIPMSLPTVNAEIAAPSLRPALNVSVLPISAPVSLPILPAAAIGQARLPGVPSPLPLPTPASLSAALIEEALALDLGANNVGAHNELRDAAHGRDPIRSPGSLFDGRREKLRDLELPHIKYF